MAEARIIRLRRTVFAACRDIGLDDETRRGLQLAATGRESLTQMGESDLRAVLAALRERGWRPSGRRAAAPRADLRLVHVLWRLLGEAGALERPGRAGLNAFVRARFGDVWGSLPADIDMLRDHTQIAAVVRALKAWCARAGVEMSR